jgi:hypothetical protein
MIGEFKQLMWFLERIQPLMEERAGLVAWLERHENIYNKYIDNYAPWPVSAIENHWKKEDELRSVEWKIGEAWNKLKQRK